MVCDNCGYETPGPNWCTNCGYRLDGTLPGAWADGNTPVEPADDNGPDPRHPGGSQTPDGDVTCGNCRAENPPDAQVCGTCGMTVDGAAKAAASGAWNYGNSTSVAGTGPGYDMDGMPMSSSGRDPWYGSEARRRYIDGWTDTPPPEMTMSLNERITLAERALEAAEREADEAADVLRATLADDAPEMDMTGGPDEAQHSRALTLGAALADVRSLAAERSATPATRTRYLRVERAGAMWQEADQARERCRAALRALTDAWADISRPDLGLRPGAEDPDRQYRPETWRSAAPLRGIDTSQPQRRR
jgi:hypothetical protein